MLDKTATGHLLIAAACSGGLPAALPHWHDNAMLRAQALAEQQRSHLVAAATRGAVRDHMRDSGLMPERAPRRVR